jgi:hypothetical protein
MRDAFRDIAQRIETAETKFVAYVVEQTGMSTDEAEHVLRVFKKCRVIKIDAVMGQWNVKHGAYLDAEVMRRAARVEL